MRTSIRIRITKYMLLFAVGIIGMIGGLTKFLLPQYYTSVQMKKIDTVSAQIEEKYQEGNIELAIEILEKLQTQMGGELYYFSQQRGVMGYGRGSGMMGGGGNLSERFIPKGDLTQYIHTNKAGIEIYTVGILVEAEYLVYEVAIQDLNHATGILLHFLWGVLLIVLVIAILLSVILSTKIAKPIQALNGLANQMKSKKIQPVMVTKTPDEIGQLNQTLNELYEELLASISQLEIQLQKERAVEQMKKRFLAQATHELKTPLSVIRGYAEILYDGMYKDEQERERFIQNIYEESESVSHLILDVLAYTRMETGHEVLEKTKVGARHYYEKVIRRYRGYITSKGLELVVENLISEDFITEIDEKKVEQVLKNLISNALQHAKSRIKIELKQVEERVSLSIFNDGEPIQAEDLPYIFDSFYKKSGKQTGTGLGLAIVKEIVLLHHGEYKVENEQGGVTFILIL